MRPSAIYFEEIAYDDPAKIFTLFSQLPWILWLDSADASIKPLPTNRYSYLLIDPFDFFIYSQGYIRQKNNIAKTCRDPWQAIQAQWQSFKTEKHEALPPLQSGMAGYFSYDLCHELEDIPLPPQKQNFPEMALGYYNQVIAFDHQAKRTFVITSGIPEKTAEKQKQLAQHHLQQLLKKIQDKKPVTLSEKRHKTPIIQVQQACSKIEYQQQVAKIIDYIAAGDIFEANLTQTFSATLPDTMPTQTLYCALRDINPAPFSAYFGFENKVIASASPERFLHVAHKCVETRPIKGTRARSKNAAQDIQWGLDLLSSIKDKAENVMIVDLLRNDLSRVCEAHSVQVPILCGLEKFAHVQHLVSVVRATLCENKDIVDLLRVCFPGGSITGAPKIRAMQIISELEKSRRGPYCGALGYLSFSGDMDTSILIRSYTIEAKHLVFQTGGAITLHSDPTEEYEEMLIKAKSLKQALGIDSTADIE